MSTGLKYTVIQGRNDFGINITRLEPGHTEPDKVNQGKYGIIGGFLVTHRETQRSPHGDIKKIYRVYYGVIKQVY